MRRIFVAGEISDDARDVISHHTQQLRAADSRCIRWIKPENLHVTLIFLGDCVPEVIDKVNSAVSDVCRETLAFEAALGGPGVFPSLTRARVLWVGVDDNNMLSEMAQRLDASLVKSDLLLKRERFHPHITIGRVKKVVTAQTIIESHLSLPVPSVRFSIDHLTVFESTLTTGGSIYTPLATHRLVVN